MSQYLELKDHVKPRKLQFIVVDIDNAYSYSRYGA